ncbi:LOW QUALITY PROTEIN: kelch-like protein 10 [Colossoma macropomum]|uniref:LOW QUALITY PROTEIN: kelch-like protein 10 n=1 Tax=Colossoma macropomum TaxID=42526 RepID=UPI001864922D|nr:LOW QUALITY PROTEIN: kelch-like protein 10 [Colossoma macropomum]
MSEQEQQCTSFRGRHDEREMSPTACTIFNEHRLEGEHCDVLIKVDGVEFSAHKIILCGCSSYFRRLFSSVWSPKEKRVYSIPGVSPEMMGLIIEYAYTRSITINEENVQELLVAADYLAVMGVVRACCQFLEDQLCEENCIGIWVFAEFCSCWQLQQKAYLFILNHFEEVVRVSEEFPRLSLRQLSSIIKRDDLNVKQEETLFEAILRWISHEPNERKGHLPALLPKVRMGLMTAEYFMNNVKNNSFVKDNKDCKPIIISALKALYDLNINGLCNTDFKNPLTRPRLPYTILLAIGGWSGGSPTNAIEAYDARADRWINVTSDEEGPRAYHGSVYLNGFVYCVGGFDGVDYFNSVRKFNPVSRTWHQVAPMHSRRCYVSVAVLNGCIYAMGGFDGQVRMNTAERYEPESNQWTMIAPMHEQRSDASATILHGKVYICGGFNGIECLFTAEFYSPESNQWSLIAPMSSRRSGVGVIALRELVYAVGGFDSNNRLRSAEAYNPVTNTWRAIHNMFNPRSNFGIEVVDEFLYVVGGFNGLTTTFKVEWYDQAADEWYQAHDMAIFRSALSCCVLPGLPNITEYTAPRDDTQSPRQEMQMSSSNSIQSI